MLEATDPEISGKEDEEEEVSIGNYVINETESMTERKENDDINKKEELEKHSEILEESKKSVLFNLFFIFCALFTFFLRSSRTNVWILYARVFYLETSVNIAWVLYGGTMFSGISALFYLLSVPLRNAALQILSNDIDDNMKGIKFIASMIKKNKMEEFDNLMKTGIILKIIELISQCNNNYNDKLQYVAVDTLTNIASINDEFTNIISIFGGIEVLNQLLIKQHSILNEMDIKQEEKQYEIEEDIENDEYDENYLLETIIWAIGNISGTLQCRIKLNEYKVYNEIIRNILKYKPKIQNVATWTITHIFDDEDDINSDIINTKYI